MVGVHAAVHLQRRDARGGGRPGRGPRRRRPHPRRRGRRSIAAGERLEPLARDDWLLVHCVHLDRDLPGHDRPQPPLQHEQRRRLRPAGPRPNPVVLGTDGIGADMLEEVRLAYARLREDDVLATPGLAWAWLEAGAVLPRGARRPGHLELRPRRLALAPRLHARRPALAWSRSDGEVLLDDGRPTRVDLDEVRAKAAEQAARLLARL